MKLGPRRNYFKGREAIRYYANQPARPLLLLVGAISVITNLRMVLFQALVTTVSLDTLTMLGTMALRSLISMYWLPFSHK